MNGVMETSSLMGDSASQLTHNLALTARASPDADQRKRQGDRDHGRDHGRGQNICGGQNEMEIQGTALAYWNTVKANKQTNKKVQRNQDLQGTQPIITPSIFMRNGEQLE